jgi:phosphatidylserine decarboxylase
VGYKDLMEVANAANKTSFNFEDMYQCDPSKKHYGFTSWDGRPMAPASAER